jgi:hypothetical protein
MSRIILSMHRHPKVPGGGHHIVIGWDRPVASYFWQEFNDDPRDQNGEVNWELASDEWTEVRRFGGYSLNELPTMQSLIEAMPVEFRCLMTEAVRTELDKTVYDPNTGSIIKDLSPQSWKVEVQTLDGSGDEWSTNGMRYLNYNDAKKAAHSLRHRWMMVKDDRVMPSDDAPNYTVNSKGEEVRI